MLEDTEQEGRNGGMEEGKRSGGIKRMRKTQRKENKEGRKKERKGWT